MRREGLLTLEDARLPQESLHPRHRARRGIQRRLKGFPLVCIQTEIPAVGQGFFGPRHRALQNKPADGTLRGADCDLQGALG